MCAVDFLRGDAVDRFDEFVVIGVVGERNGMIDAQAVLRAAVHRPARYGEANRMRNLARIGADRIDHCPSRQGLPAKQVEAAQWATKLFVLSTDLINRAVL